MCLYNIYYRKYIEIYVKSVFYNMLEILNCCSTVTPIWGICHLLSFRLFFGGCIKLYLILCIWFFSYQIHHILYWVINKNVFYMMLLNCCKLKLVFPYQHISILWHLCFFFISENFSKIFSQHSLWFYEFWQNGEFSCTTLIGIKYSDHKDKKIEQ